MGKKAAIDFSMTALNYIYRIASGNCRGAEARASATASAGCQCGQGQQAERSGCGFGDAVALGTEVERAGVVVES